MSEKGLPVPAGAAGENSNEGLENAPMVTEGES